MSFDDLPEEQVDHILRCVLCDRERQGDGETPQSWLQVPAVKLVGVVERVALADEADAGPSVRRAPRLGMPLEDVPLAVLHGRAIVRDLLLVGAQEREVLAGNCDDDGSIDLLLAGVLLDGLANAATSRVG